MKILVCGDRNWRNVFRILEVLSSWPKDSIIIEGGARGADTLARVVADKLNLEWIEVKADWQIYGKSAGPRRNRKMLDLDPDVVIGFHNDISSSKGTRDTLNEAVRRGIMTFLITDDKTYDYNLKKEINIDPSLGDKPR